MLILGMNRALITIIEHFRFSMQHFVGGRGTVGSVVVRAGNKKSGYDTATLFSQDDGKAASCVPA